MFTVTRVQILEENVLSKVSFVFPQALKCKENGSSENSLNCMIWKDVSIS